MPDKIGGIEIEVSASPDAERKMAVAGKKSGEAWTKTFIASVNNGVEKASSTTFGKHLFGNRTYNIQNQATGYQGGILSGAASSMNKESLIKLGIIAGGIGAAVGILAEMSPALKKQLGMFGSAMTLFFRPFGDMLATLLRPALIWLIKMGVLWYQTFGSKTAQAAMKAGWDLFTNPLGTALDLSNYLRKALMDPKTWDAIQKDAASTWEAIRVKVGEVASIVWNYWTWIDNKASEIWNGAVNTIKNIWGGLAGIITTPLQKVVDFVNGITWPSWLGGGGGSSGGGGGGSNTGPWFGGSTNADTLASIGLPTPLSERNNQIFGDPNPFNQYAEGGIAWNPQIASIAENGPEAIIPLSKLKGGGTTVNIEVNIQATDKTQIINEVTRKLSMELQRRLSVYG